MSIRRRNLIHSMLLVMPLALSTHAWPQGAAGGIGAQPGVMTPPGTPGPTIPGPATPAPGLPGNTTLPPSPATPGSPSIAPANRLPGSPNTVGAPATCNCPPGTAAAQAATANQLPGTAATPCVC